MTIKDSLLQLIGTHVPQKTEAKNPDVQVSASGNVEQDQRCSAEKFENEVKSLKHRIWQLKGLNHAAYREDRAYRGFERKTLINIGAGGFYHKRWTNLDVSSEHYDSMRRGTHVEYNIMTDERIPFPDGSVAIAYTSHTIEHIKDEYIQRMFCEVYRCLEAGGIFRITCPDADLYYMAMTMNMFDRFFHRRRAWFEKAGVADSDVSGFDYMKMAFATALSSTPLLRHEKPELWERIQEKFRTAPKDEFLEFLSSQVEFSIPRIACHINWWTAEKVTRFLRNAGFKTVRTSTYGGSLAAPMCDINLFDNTVPDESLYVEAYKV
ncbi:methyltransferase domain-containing protein [Sinorhizobium medicae]|nr:methyltransferase domain-containing protein [Sinorhizobium medicae]MDX0747707.1 methyltransferase domain-containing protein [Sinorhizobium medicae]